MEGEELSKVAPKRRKKPAFDSGDDEPIGSFLKLKNKKNLKRGKTGVDAKLVEGDQDLAGMDDTLASFRKKLKGSKKDGGGLLMQNVPSDVVEPSDRFVDGCRIDGDVVGELIPKGAERGQGTDFIEGNSEKSKKKSKTGKGSIVPKKMGDGYKPANILSCQKTGDVLLPCENEAAGNSLDDNLDDSLSAFFHKVQSGLTRKAHNSLKVKEERITRAPSVGLSSSSSGALEVPPDESSFRSRSALEDVEITKESADVLDEGAGFVVTAVGNSGPDSRVPQVFNSTKGNTKGFESAKADPSAPLLLDKTSHFEADIDDSCNRGLSEDPAKKRYSASTTEITSAQGSKSYFQYKEKTGGQIVNIVPGDYKDMGTEKLCSVSDKKGVHKHMAKVDVDFKGRTIPRVIGVVPSSFSALEQTEINQFDKFVAAMDNDKSNPDIDGTKRNQQLAASSQSSFKFTSCELKKDFDGHGSDQYEKEQSCDLNSRFSQMPVLGLRKDNLVDLMGNHDKSFEAIDNNFDRETEQENSENLTERNGYTSFQNQIPRELSTGACLLNDQDAYADESSSPKTPCHVDYYAENPEDTLKLQSKENKISDHPRVVRKPKKRRHRDMAYEGDADWENLLHGQDDLVFKDLQECEPSSPSKRITNSSLFSEAAAAAAVSVGLKACGVGPVEKIKFKEVLKRKGGLQDYLECRNHIVNLWNKDVSRILPLSDCGRNEHGSIDEFTRESLVRDVYTFLDQRGYINSGVASWKERAESGDTHDLKLFEEKLGGRTGASLADAEDGVSFILGKVKTLSNNIDKGHGLAADGMEGPERSEAVGNFLGFQTVDSSPSELQDNSTNACQKYDHNNVEEPKEDVSSDSMHLLSLSKDEGQSFNVAPLELFSENKINLDGAMPISHSRSPKISSDLQCGEAYRASHEMQCDLETKKKIIIVGAGPAGLTAARHLQRQGFCVNVLEARSRIGGRVFTDRSSLSVPVDLGASIITGVEADVATERRADPSSLVCAQLGLELTVLNSDCPLYDTVSGQKVPSDLDEALEAEYNGLLDDMILLVAQKGEHAMRMSLEEGLEYALKLRSMARFGKDFKSIDILKSSDKLSNNGVPDNVNSAEGTLSPLERRVMDWHFANLEYGCAALLKEVSLPYWNQDDEYGGFGGAHCMIKGGYSAVAESLAGGLFIHLDHVVTDILYGSNCLMSNNDQNSKVKVLTSNGREFLGDAVLVTVPLGCLKAGRITFSPPLPQWKSLSIDRLGFGVLNKVVLEFSEVFWDENIDYFGATADETDLRGQCFMFWNVKKTVGAPVLIALVVGKAAADENLSSTDHVNHALVVLRKLFGENQVPDPVAFVMTDWGRDPYSYGAYSYVAVGSSGEDYDILGKPVENSIFFAGEATCKEHPDTVGGAMMSGLREAVRIMDILNTGVDHSAEIEAEESAERHSDVERNEVRDIITRLEALELSNVLCKNSLDHAKILTREGLLRDMFLKAKTTAGRLHLIKELLNLPVNVLKSFAGTREGMGTLNSWILDSMGKDGTQLLRHCVRLLVRVSTDLLAVRLSGIGKTVKEKVCVHTSRDIRAIASQLVNVWVEIFRKEKASLKNKTYLASGKPPLRMHNHAPDYKGSQKVQSAVNPITRKVCPKPARVERADSISEAKSSSSQGSGGKKITTLDDGQEFPISEEEKAAFTEAEAARAAALAAAEAYASGSKLTMPLPLPKIPSFHKFARREQYARMDESDIRRNWSAGATGKQDCLSEIDSRNCRVRDWSVDFSAAGVNFESSRKPVDNCSQQSHSNDMASQMNFGEHSGETAPVDSSLLTKAWVDSSGSVEGKDYNAIERWQCQAAAANFGFYNRSMDVTDEEDSNMISKLPSSKHKPFMNESSASQITINEHRVNNQERGADRIKQGVVDYVASLLMPLYKARKIDKDGYKSIMKKTATKVMEAITDAEKTMMVVEFLDSKRKNKIRAFVDKLIERHMSMKPSGIS